MAPAAWQATALASVADPSRTMSPRERPMPSSRALPAARPAQTTIGRVATAALLAALVIVGPAVPAVPASAAPPRNCGPVVTDPLAEEPWALTGLRPDLAWRLRNGAGITVGLIDSGVSADHAMLSGKILHGIDYVVPGGDGTCDENGHGTLIAGIIAGRAATSGGFRLYGVAPGAVIVPVRVLRDQQRAFGAELSVLVATAIRYAV